MSKKKKQPDRPAEPNGEANPPATEGDGEMDIFAERDDLLQRLQRLSADYANYQKRAQREKTEDRTRAQAEVIKTLLPVLDDMERALEAALENHGQDDPLFQGMHLVHDKALELLGGFGLTAIDAVGKSFDPDRHAAMMQQPTDEHPPQTVLQELQKGYALKDQTLRPSRVIVSVEPQPEDDGAESSGAESEPAGD